jgi:ribose transport system permease protein
MNTAVGRLLFRGSAELAALAGLLAVLMCVYWYYDRTIFTGPSILALAVQVSPLAFAAMGQAIVMLTRGIDLSVGSVVAVAMGVFALNAGDSGGTVLVAAAMAIGAAVLAGLLNGCLVALAGLPPIIVTLSTSFLWSGVAVWILPKPDGSVPDGLREAWTKGFQGINVPIIALVVVLIAWKVLSRTRFGLSVYAVGGNEHGAFANGISVRRVTIGAYVASSVLIALAGIVLAIQTGTADATIGTPYTLNSIAASILGGVIFLGGVGFLRGAVLGAITVVVISNILLFSGVSPFYQLIVQGAILIVAVSIKTILNSDKVVV